MMLNQNCANSKRQVSRITSLIKVFLSISLRQSISLNETISTRRSNPNLWISRYFSVSHIGIDLEKNTEKKITILFVLANTENVFEECVPLLFGKVNQKDRVYDIRELIQDVIRREPVEGKPLEYELSQSHSVFFRVRRIPESVRVNINISNNARIEDRPRFYVILDHLEAEESSRFVSHGLR